MRSTYDRIRQALMFEIIGLLVVSPLAAVIFEVDLLDVGTLAVVGASLATGWNYAYNLIFDHVVLRLRGRVDKSLTLRVVHAVLFEVGLLAAMLPVIAWWFDIGLVQALAMDLSFALFYVVYAFVFTWGYERVFPAPNARQRTSATA